MIHINEFHTTDSVKLARELPELEDNVDEALQALAAATCPQLTLIAFSALGAAMVVPLLADQQVSVDTDQGNAIAVLPSLAAANFGRRFVLIKQSVNNSVAITCQDPGARHNGGAFPTIAAQGVRVFYCDARGYYS